MTRGTVVVAALLTGAACAARAPARPTGSETPDATAVQAFQQITRLCAGLKTATAEIRLSGRAGEEPLRGTLHAGFAAPASLRFEAVAPFGRPVFILASRDNRATLFFPRDNRVLMNVALPEVLDRLTSLALGADDLRLILTGCLGDAASAADGRAWPGGWQAVRLGKQVTVYLRTRSGQGLVVAADYGPWRVDYADHISGWPRTVRIRSADSDRVNATARLDQLEINADVDDRAFVVDVPTDAERLTLEDLRAITPLRGSP